MAISESTVVSIFSAVCGVIIAYIVNVASQKVQAKKVQKQPKDRMEQMFDGYERLIKQKDRENDRKDTSIGSLERNIVNLEAELDMVKTLHAETKEELRKSREECIELKRMLEDMRREYTKVKQ